MKQLQVFQCVKQARGARLMRKLCLAAIGVPLLAAVAIGTANASEEDGRDSYAIGLWGDLPYSDIQAQVGVPNLIADMNAQKLAFTVHDGDLKAGNATLNSATPTPMTFTNRHWDSLMI
jgi:hypothetical protein